MSPLWLPHANAAHQRPGTMKLPGGDPCAIERCPACGRGWTYQADGEIGLLRELRNTYTRLLGVEYQGGYDGISEWRCPDCAARWNRWTLEPIL